MVTCEPMTIFLSAKLGSKSISFSVFNNLIKRFTCTIMSTKRKQDSLEDKIVIDGEKAQSIKKKRPEKPEELFNDSEYYIENNLRKVYPYYYTYKAFCKRRWLGLKVIDVFRSEFRSLPSENLLSSFTRGLVKVNNEVIDESYVLKDNDLITNTVHRHECPVLACSLEIIHLSDDMLVIDKPPSVPIHPCGRYRHNTITTLLETECGFKHLYGVHRLDRLTSGILLFARNPQKSSEISEQIRQRVVHKEYVCRVEGNFPDEEITCNEPIELISPKIGISYVSPNGRECTTTFKKLNYNGKTSTVLCKPLTGRMHQIRVHLQYLGFPITNDCFYNNHIFGPKKGKLGDYGGKTKEELSELIHKTFCRDNHILTENNQQEKDEKQQNEAALKALSNYLTQEKYNELKEKYKFDRNKLLSDEYCDECKLKTINPEPEELFLYLHALRYKGPNWEFETKMPIWARDDWQD